MKAVALTQYLPVENPESFLDVELPTPVASGLDLLIAVKAVSINPVDTKVRSPKDKIEEAPRVLGWDASGVVEAVGPDVTLFKVGDEVYYTPKIFGGAGSYAEQHVADVELVGRKPPTSRSNGSAGRTRRSRCSTAPTNCSR